MKIDAFNLNDQNNNNNNNNNNKYKNKHKKSLQRLYPATLLIDSVYRKNENYYSKVFLENCYFMETEYFFNNSDKKYHDKE